MNASDVIDRLDKAHESLRGAIAELHGASKAAIKLAHSLSKESEAKLADDDEWTRMPVHPNRCPVSGWSRSTLNRKVVSKAIRGKTVDHTAYYSLADVRNRIRDGKKTPALA